MLTRPRITRTVGVTAVVAVVMLALSACITVKADMTINSDAKATGTLALEFEKQAANFLGINSIDDFTSGITDDQTAGSLASLTDCTASENDTAYIYSCTFADQEFATEGEAPWTITKQGSTIVMTVVNEGQTADAGSEDLLGDASLGTISISATFPGTITEVTGAGATKESDTTVQIEASLTDNVNVTVVSEASSGGSISSVLVIALFIAVLGLIILVAIVMIMRRRGKGGEASESVETAAPAAATVAGATTDVGPVTEDVPAPAATAADAAVTEDTVVVEAVTDEVVVVDSDETVVAEAVTDDTVVVEAVTEEASTVEPITEDVPAPDRPTDGEQGS